MDAPFTLIWIKDGVHDCKQTQHQGSWRRMKIIEVVTDSGHVDTILGLAEQHGLPEAWVQAGPEADARSTVRLLVPPDKRRTVMDALQVALGGSSDARVVVLPVEAVWPALQAEEAPASKVQVSREELYNQVERGARPDPTYFLLVFLSTVVAAIGLVQDNVAVIIGAMVIAPLLGPNIALALGTALGDRTLMWRATQALVFGMLLAAALSWLIGYLWPGVVMSREILARTDVGLDGVALALASGTAAVLSLTTGLSSVLVGVMVAVALLPPTAAMGILLGAGQTHLAVGAALLLAVNVVCVNLAAKLTLLFKGVRPRTWLEKRKARQSTGIYLVIWILSLAILIGAMYLRHRIQ